MYISVKNCRNIFISEIENSELKNEIRNLKYIYHSHFHFKEKKSIYRFFSAFEITKIN